MIIERVRRWMLHLMFPRHDARHRLVPARARLLAAGWVATACCAVELRADALWVLSSTGKQAAIESIRISGASEGRVSYEDSSGRRGERELAQVMRISLDDEPAFTSGERAYTEHRWADAVDAYRRALQTTRRQWVRAWTAPRLIEAGENAGRVDASAAGYVAMVRTNPRRAENYVPAAPEDDPRGLQAAAAEVSAALSDPALTGQQRQCLMSFLLDLHRARKDLPAADQVLDQMLKSGDAAANRAVVRKKLDAIQQALARQQYRQAANEITRNKAIFEEARDQAEAMYYLAEAAAGLAAAGGGSSTTTRSAHEAAQQAWKDAALAYMRVVAHFKDSPGAPFVAASLLKTASIEERLDNAMAARQLYEQVDSQFTGTPAAASARAGLMRLRGK